MKTNMLSNNEVLRQVWGGPLQELVVMLNGKRGPDTLKMLNKLLRNELMILPKPKKSKGIKIVKSCQSGSYDTYILKHVSLSDFLKYRNPSIHIDKNVDRLGSDIISYNNANNNYVLEFGRFGESVNLGKIWAWQTELFCSAPSYEDALFFIDTNDKNQSEEGSYAFIPECPIHLDFKNSVIDRSATAIITMITSEGTDLTVNKISQKVYILDYDSSKTWETNYIFARRNYNLGQ